MLCEPLYFKDNNFKANDANDIIPSNIISDFVTLIGNGDDIITLRSSILELFGSVIIGNK